MEATVKHLETVYPLAKYEKAKDAFAKKHGLANLAGLCFFPDRVDDAVFGNYTNIFKVVLVKWTSAPAGPITFYQVDEYLLDAASTGTALASDFSADLLDIDNLSGWDEFRFYNDTGEFEYAFIDRQTFEYLASASVFYSGGVPSGFQSGFPNRGLLVSRAFITMQGGTAGNNYQKFRALRMAPYPEPPLPTDAAGRASIAYYIGPPCPPYWHDDGTASSATGSSGGGGSLAGPAPIMFSTEQTSNTPPLNDCNCIVNQINKVELHKQLREHGLISNEPPPIYKMRIWPWIVLAILIFLFAVIGVVELIRGDTFLGLKN